MMNSRVAAFFGWSAFAVACVGGVMLFSQAPMAKADVSERELWDQCLALQNIAYGDSSSVGERVLTRYMAKFGVTREEAVKIREEEIGLFKTIASGGYMSYDQFANILENCPSVTGETANLTGRSYIISIMKSKLQPDAYAADRQRMAEEDAQRQKEKETGRCSRYADAVDYNKHEVDSVINNPGTTYQNMSRLEAVCKSYRRLALRMDHFQCDKEMAVEVSKAAEHAHKWAEYFEDKQFPEENAPLDCYSSDPEPIGYDE